MIDKAIRARQCLAIYFSNFAEHKRIFEKKNLNKDLETIFFLDFRISKEKKYYFFSVVLIGFRRDDFALIKIINTT